MANALALHTNISSVQSRGVGLLLSLVLRLGLPFAISFQLPSYGITSHVGKDPCEAILHPATEYVLGQQGETYFAGGPAAVEMEMPVKSGVLGVLDTDDELVRGLVTAWGLPAPELYLDWARRAYPGEDPQDIEWDLLPDEVKMAFLQYYSKSAKIDFSRDRSVPGVRVRDVVRIKLHEPSNFFDQRLIPGTHELDVRAARGRVEFVEQGTMRQFSLVELHLRSPKIDAGILLDSAWTFQTGIGAKNTHLHEHLLFKIPSAELEQKPIETGLVLVEYFRRANLLAEFISAGALDWIHTQRQFSLFTPGYFIYQFDSIKPHFLSGIFFYLVDGFKRDIKIKTMFKVGWVGFRGHDFYDTGEHFGFEYRNITPNGDRQLYKKVLSSIQRGLLSKNYGFSSESMLAWIAERGIAKNDKFGIRQLLEASWYGQKYSYLLRHLPSYLRPVLGGTLVARKNILRLRMLDPGNHAIKMLLHDWSLDPLFYGDENAVERLKEEQRRALTRVLKEGASLRAAIWNFIHFSGLLERVAATFYLQKSDFEPPIEIDPRFTDRGSDVE